MTAPHETTKVDASATLLPRHVQRVVLGLAGLLLVGAVYLMLVRGPAILFDLARGAMAFCF